jgi:hypothetical protein
MISAQQKTERVNLTIKNGKIIELQRGRNSTSLRLTIYAPYRIENLGASDKSNCLIYDNPKKEPTLHSFTISKGAIIKITLLNSSHSQVLSYQGRNLVKLIKYTTWTRERYRRR